MSTYLVTWAIDVEDVKDPERAARKALAAIRRRGSIAHVFDVQDKDTGESVTVDLNELNGDPM